MALDLSRTVSLFGSGQDTNNFYQTAMAVYLDPTKLDDQLYGGLFPKLCGVMFQVFGPSRLLVQYTNVLLGVTTVALIWFAMQRLPISDGVRLTVTSVAALLPIPAVLSSLFLRESLVMFFIACSVFAFALWIQNGGVWRLSLVLLSVASASLFHFGVLGLLPGYLLASMLLDRTTGQLSLKLSNLLQGLTVAVGGVILLSQFPAIFLEKLQTFDSSDELITAAAASAGESAYLPGIAITGPTDMVLWGGVKALFFVASPLPFQWRGSSDAASFLLDAVFYVAAAVLVVFALARRRNRATRLAAVLALGLAAAIFVLGLGTANAGTAMRHRAKLLPVASVTAALAFAGLRSRTDLTTTLSPLPRRGTSRPERERFMA